MDTLTLETAKTVAQELNIAEEDVLKLGLSALVERELRAVKAEIFEITGRYNVSSAQEIENRYKEGSLEEADSWRDLQRLDHLEYRRDRLSELLETIA
jgi:hypothetical protein